ncbi:MAG: hypothetical protein K2O41_07465 [Clostridia bacterium]|nr:hypothetical protein [Clostridia bacterium]
MEKQPNFYKLDKSKPYKAEGAASRQFSKWIIIFSSFYLSFLVLFVVISVITDIGMFEEVTAIIAPVFLFVLGAFFLCVGLIYRKKDKKQNHAEQEILKNCLLTDGRIKEYHCREIRGSDNSHTTYDVTLEYTFYDKDMNLRLGIHACSYNYDPQFYRGQYLMIAFNETDSLILKEFTIVKEDEEKFLDNEAQRSADDFDDLTGELLDIDLNKPIKDYEYAYGFLWAAFAVFIFAAAYTIPISILVAPQIITINWLVPELIAFIGIYILPLALTPAIICLLRLYIKKKRKFKRLMNGKPYFTFGKMFASETTYRDGMRKKVFYCYIDKWGEKHTELVTSTVFHLRIQDENLDVVVAYDALGNSTVILECTPIDED